MFLPNFNPYNSLQFPSNFDLNTTNNHPSLFNYSENFVKKLYHDVGQLTRVKFYLCPNYRDYTFLLLYEASTLPGVQVVIDKGIQVLIDNG
jgi:hypothetical protein